MPVEVESLLARSLQVYHAAASMSRRVGERSELHFVEHLFYLEKKMQDGLVTSVHPIPSHSFASTSSRVVSGVTPARSMRSHPNSVDLLLSPSAIRP